MAKKMITMSSDDGLLHVRSNAMKRVTQASAPPRARKPIRTATRVAFLVGILLPSGFIFQVPAATPEMVPVTDTRHPAVIAETPEANAEDAIQFIVVDPPIKEHHYLESVTLDLQTQDAIWEACRENPRLFCTVMAIARNETIFDPEVIGDNGNSLGLLQIQPRWHQDRMNRLGVTDLMDPVQNAMVAVDYIDWIAEQLNPESPEDAYGTHSLLMAYNQGWSGANKSWSNGIYSTKYSRAAIGHFETYLAELEVAQ